MTGKDLKAWCMEMGGEKGCSVCPAQKACAKWKDDLKKLANMEPWELDEIEKITGHLINGYDYKHGREI